MTDPREQACREVLERLAIAERLRLIRAELRALDVSFLAPSIARAIRHEHYRVHLLAGDLGLPLLTMRDVAAFCRAQLGLPIDAPLAPCKPIRRPRAALLDPSPHVDALTLLGAAPAA